MAFRNLAREYTTTTGTSDVVLTGAVPGCNTWEDAGVTNSEIVRYGITTYNLSNNRATHREVGTGSYNTATNTLARTTVESSTAAGAKITLTGLSQVYILPTALDFNSGGNPFASYTQNGSATTVANTASDDELDLDTEVVDANGLATLASDIVTINVPGWYEITGFVGVTSGANWNGYIEVYNNWQFAYEKHIYVTANAVASDSFVLPPTLIQITTTGNVSVGLNNQSGQSVTATVFELTIKKLGNL